MKKLLAVIAASVVGMGCIEPEPEPASASQPGTGSGGAITPASLPLMPFRPVVGGHLLVTADGQRVAMADVEGDRLRVYSVAKGALEYDVLLPRQSWPTRIVEGNTGEFHVLLRGTGEVATVRGQEVTLLAVCAEPRALALEPDGSELTVACAGGELVRIVNGSVLETTQTGVEWRDIVLTAHALQGTSFRSAEVVTLADGHSVSARLRSPSQLTPGLTGWHEAQVAWRMVPAGAKTFLVHQLHAERLSVRNVDPRASSSSRAYGGAPAPAMLGQVTGCGNAAVVTAISTIQNGEVTSVQRSSDVLPVDAALSPDGTQLAVVGAGGTGLSVYPLTAMNSTSSCLVASAGLPGLALNSVAWISPTRLVLVESLRASPMMFDLSTGQSHSFGSDSGRGSPAHALFHQAPRGGAPLACASCHPEGGEDGHTWVIDGKRRRTQTLSGGVMQRAPFHWQGELLNLDTLMSDTFIKRMGGSRLLVEQVSSLGAWLENLPAPRASRRLDQAQRVAGLGAFTKAQCGSCHLSGGTGEGPASDIGTGERVRAPSLSGLAARAPYLHTGEIPDIRTRVTGSLHPQHGRLGLLNAAEREELIYYLESL